MDPFAWTWQCWLTNKNLQQLCTNTGSNLGDLSGTMDGKDEWRQRAARFDDDDDDDDDLIIIFCFHSYTVSSVPI